MAEARRRARRLAEVSRAVRETSAHSAAHGPRAEWLAAGLWKWGPAQLDELEPGVQRPSAAPRLVLPTAPTPPAQLAAQQINGTFTCITVGGWVVASMRFRMAMFCFIFILMWVDAFIAVFKLTSGLFVIVFLAVVY